MFDDLLGDRRISNVLNHESSIQEIRLTRSVENHAKGAVKTIHDRHADSKTQPATIATKKAISRGYADNESQAMKEAKKAAPTVSHRSIPRRATLKETNMMET